MPRMRHPGGAGPYEALEEQVSHMRMGGWLTRDEWEQRKDLPEWEPEPEPEEDEQQDKPDDEPGEQNKPSRRARPTSQKEK